MEGMRGFAVFLVFLVFLVHYTTMVEPWIDGALLLHFARTVRAAGHIGVDIFFVLSGYLVYGSLLTRPQAFVPYLRRRIQRIYPAFLAVFALYIVLSIVFPEHRKIPSSTLRAVAYLAQNFFLLPGIFPIEPLIAVTWSLSYEMVYYLALPLGIGVLGLRRRSPAVRSALLLGAAVAMTLFFARFGGPIQLTLFIAGMLLFEWRQVHGAPGTARHLGWPALAVGMAAMLGTASDTIGRSMEVAVLFASLFVFCLAGLQNAFAPMSRVFCWTPLRWLGNMSYSYYLLHGPGAEDGVRGVRTRMAARRRQRHDAVLGAASRDVRRHPGADRRVVHRRRAAVLAGQAERSRAR